MTLYFRDESQLLDPAVVREIVSANTIQQYLNVATAVTLIYDAGRCIRWSIVTTVNNNDYGSNYYG